MFYHCILIFDECILLLISASCIMGAQRRRHPSCGAHGPPQERQPEWWSIVLQCYHPRTQSCWRENPAQWPLWSYHWKSQEGKCCRYCGTSITRYVVVPSTFGYINRRSLCWNSRQYVCCTNQTIYSISSCTVSSAKRASLDIDCFSRFSKIAPMGVDNLMIRWNSGT